MAAARSLATRDPLPLLDQRFPERVVKVGADACVAVRQHGVRGAAPTLVLLHGISSGAASWLHAVLALPPQQHVIAWEAPGYGRSTPLLPPFPAAADYAERLHGLLQALEIRRCVLVGHSLGALMACAYAAREETIDVQRLVLISPARGYGADAEEAERVRRERTQALERKGVAGLAAQIDQRLLSAQATPAQRQWVRAVAGRLQPDGYLQAVEMLCRSVLAPVRANVPVEVHCGEADVVTPPTVCEQAACALGGSYHAIAGAGHASPVEQPEAVAALLRAAVEQEQAEGHSHG
jgi:pimeloyl-ACP methyl ester carboxylesterase